MTDLFFVGLYQERNKNEKHESLNKCWDKLQQLLGETELMFVRRRYAKILQQEYSRRYPNNETEDEEGLQLRVMVNMLTTPSIPLSLKVIPQKLAEYWRNERILLIRKVIQEGVFIDFKLLEEYPIDTFKEELLVADVSKQKNILFQTISIQNPNTFLLKDYGCRVIHQDGTPVSGKVRDQIEMGLQELWKALGSIKDLCLVNEVIIAHTAGKNIYGSSSNTVGIYDPVREIIVLGRRRVHGDGEIWGLAHELAGHWLDHISVPPSRWLDHLFGKDSLFTRKSITVSFLDSWLQRDKSLISRAVWLMNRFHRAVYYFDNRLLFPSEVWARLVEQYVAWRLFRKHIKLGNSVMTLKYYFNSDGYWNETNWKELVPLVSDQVQARLWMARKVAGLNPSNRKQAPPFYRSAFPWANSEACWLTALDGKGVID